MCYIDTNLPYVSVIRDVQNACGHWYDPKVQWLILAKAQGKEQKNENFPGQAWFLFEPRGRLVCKKNALAESG